ncbi:MAG TPA: hypothetical protein PKY30_18110 [Myxococcota bacterium]|nr:hypothetical protein [Myxococcota bacterium]HNH48964.1 hypothetical protein [Myxococcota bacterium]
MNVDFHMHSAQSDGRFSPEELLRRAVAGGLDVVALSDHDLPPALPVGLQPGQKIRVVAATEVSGVHEGRELHLLVYFPGAMPEDYQAWLRERARWRAWRFDRGAEALGLPDRADADALEGRRSLTRQHLAGLLMHAGKVQLPGQVWPMLSKILPPLELSYAEAIAVARAAGGVPVWAHPGLADAQNFLPDLVRAGLVGIELDRPLLAKNVRNGLKALACRFKLLPTGGSDWHGWKEGELGAFRVAREYYQPLMDRLGV